MTRGCTGLLLAAGQSRRFGANKLLQPLDDGTPMVVASLRHLQAVVADSIAVVNDPQGEVATLLAAEGVRLVENARAHEGLGTSIACGVAACPDAQGWIIALGDMPYIPEPVIQAVVSGLEQGADIIAPLYREQRGHPVGFAARHAGALMRLQADEGARIIISENPDSLTLIDVHDRAVVLDVDSPAALNTRLQPDRNSSVTSSAGSGRTK
jgi:molybdenum cofactor cytidylyltransferase